MTTSAQQTDPYQNFDATTLDYERAYQECALVEGVVLDRMPWDIGGPQPVLVNLEEEGRVYGDVLDIGCGPGDNAIHLAKRGYHVTGLDIAPTAVDMARSRAAEQGADTTVLVPYLKHATSAAFFYPETDERDPGRISRSAV